MAGGATGTQKKSQNWPRAKYSTPFSDFFWEVLGQKCNCSDGFWEQNKIDTQSGCWLFVFVLNLEVSFEQTFFWNWASGQVVVNFLSIYALFIVVISHVVEGVENIWNMFWTPSNHVDIARLLKFPQLNCVGQIHESIGDLWQFKSWNVWSHFSDDASYFRRGAWGKSFIDIERYAFAWKATGKIRG